MDIDWSIIAAHKQKYQYSCVPSAVEMILKLLKKVDIDYYCLQDHWEDLKMNFCNYVRREFCQFEIFDNITIKGVTFHRICCNAPKLFEKIDEELSSERGVMVSVQYHIWIIYGKKDSKYLNFSKGHNTEQIICLPNLEGLVHNKGEETDILAYRT